MERRYAIGLDFGTLSLRGVLVDVRDGTQVGVCVRAYPHGIMDTVLSDGTALPGGYALQDPRDYIDVTMDVLTELAHVPGVAAGEIIGIGSDATACTLLPVDEAFRPLCFDERFRHEPHAYIKLWKHHGAQAQADRLTEQARSMGLSFLQRCGGSITSESAYPKILETLENAPEVYRATHRFMEIGDWIVWLLTGCETRNAVVASFHLQWDPAEGFPPDDFFTAVHPGLAGLVDEKLGCGVMSAYAWAGGLLPTVAERTGLKAGTSVCCCNGDGNTPLNCLGIDRPGIGALILGTSSVLMFLTEEAWLVKGCVGMVDSVLRPGYYGHVFGQSSAGDALSWYMEDLLPHRYFIEAEARGISVYALMGEKLRGLDPARGDVVALDWFNGCRSLQMNADLTSAIAGLSLRTKPEEIYRALIEALAFGYRRILDACADKGIALERLRVCGGLALNNPEIPVLFADVLGIPVEVSRIAQAVCLGSAISGAAAAGRACGGWDDPVEAGAHMAQGGYDVHLPRPESRARYDALYERFLRLAAFSEGH